MRRVLEIAEAHEQIAEEKHALDLGLEPARLFGAFDLDDLSRVQSDDGSVDGIHGEHARGLAGALDLHLGRHGDELVENLHGRRMDALAHDAHVARPAVSKAKAPERRRIAEDRPAHRHSLQEFHVGLEFEPPFLVLVLRKKVREPAPVQVEHLRVLQDLARLECDALGNHEAHTAAYAVARHAREIAVNGCFAFLGRLAVDAHRTAPHNGAHFVVLDAVLPGKNLLLIDAAFLDIALDLVAGRLVAVELQFLARIIA